MDQFETVFKHYPEYRIIVCRDCRSGVIPKNVATHLDGKHACLSKITRRSVAQVVQGLPQLADRPEDVVYPEPTSDAVEILPVWTNGFRCTAEIWDGLPCNHINRSIGDIRKHCKVA